MNRRRKPAAATYPTRLAELLARRPELRGIGITAIAEARWTA